MYILPARQGGRATKGAIREPMVARGEEKQAKSGRPGHQGSDSGADGCPRGGKAGEIRPAGPPRERFGGRWLPAGRKNGRNRAGRATKEAIRGPMVARGEEKRAKPGRPDHQGERFGGRWLPAGRKSGRNQAGRATKRAIRGLMVARGKEKRAKSCRQSHQGSDSGADGCPREGKQTGNLGQRERKRYEIIRMCGRHG